MARECVALAMGQRWFPQHSRSPGISRCYGRSGYLCMRSRLHGCATAPRQSQAFRAPGAAHSRASRRRLCQAGVAPAASLVDPWRHSWPPHLNHRATEQFTHACGKHTAPAELVEAGFAPPLGPPSTQLPAVGEPSPMGSGGHDCGNCDGPCSCSIRDLRSWRPRYGGIRGA